MSMVDIVIYPDERLRRQGEKVTDFKDPNVQKIIDDMIETLQNTPNCGGLACTQMAFETPKHITVMKGYHKPDEIMVVVNGEIIDAHGELYESEGCMSILGVFFPVKRSKYVKMRAQDRHGTSFELEEDGTYWSRNFQHELDHLEGVLSLDYLSPFKRERIEKKIAKHLKKTHKETR